jgi:hypothetical protein
MRYTDIFQQDISTQILKGTLSRDSLFSNQSQQAFVFAEIFALKGQSHEKVYEFLTWDGSFSLN